MGFFNDIFNNLGGARTRWNYCSISHEYIIEYKTNLLAFTIFFFFFGLCVILLLPIYYNDKKKKKMRGKICVIMSFM